MTKVKLDNEQIIQMKNISDTLVEATEHFTTHIKDREFIQSIHIFSSIVEGYEAIKKMCTLYDNRLTDATALLKKFFGKKFFTSTN